MTRSTLAVLSALLMSTPAFAQSREPSHLRGNGQSSSAGLRDMYTDRPDATESAHTVDVGRYQLEIGAIGWSRNEQGASPVETTSGPEVNLRTGISDNTELSIVITPWVSTETAGNTTDSFDDIGIRYKINIWGNDGLEETALALMPYISIPSGDKLSSDHVTGGIMIPFELSPNAWESAGVGLAFMVDLGVGWDAADGDYEGYLGHTAVIGFDVIGPLGAFIEYEGTAHADAGYESYLNTGMQVSVNEHFAIDAAVGFGLNDNSDDIRVWGGISWRI